MGANKSMYGKIMEGLRALEQEEAQRPKNYQPEWCLISYKGYQNKIFLTVGLSQRSKIYSCDPVNGYDYLKCRPEHEEEVKAELMNQGFKIIDTDYQ
jgi:hypothetical protein